ncbi:DUF5681 domain-containing protein [Rhodoferax sp.]|uniref:DUF5681 domain-containing protein n=1 Tax=Rhodoferax sp. TaxID=50421 RepID=UPI0025DAB0D2|nr:DUF5681 domain-containing protein [Rhodoferax sp.]
MKNTKFQKGTSGNPQGRPRGIGRIGELRKRIADDMDSIVSSLVAAAKAGDTQAAKLLLDRVIPTLRPMEQAEPMALTGDNLTAKGESVLQGLVEGNLSSEQAARLVAVLAGLARVEEFTTLEQRIAQLEART